MAMDETGPSGNGSLRKQFDQAKTEAQPLDVEQARAHLAERLFGISAEPIRLGRFRILRRLGAGAMGMVYEASDDTGERVALKTLTRLDPEGLYRLKQEFRVCAALHHPNVVQLRELHADGKVLFFSMELVDGIDWLQYLRSEGTDGSPDFERLRRAFLQLVGAVKAVHDAGLLHGDIKPSNVLVTAEGRVVLLDFGMARSRHKDALVTTAANLLGGTPAYMAPEQFNGHPSSMASDWYAVGVLLYQSLTGRLPHVGDDMPSLCAAKQRDDPAHPSRFVGPVPEPLDTLCMAMLGIQPDRRPPGSEILARLEDAPGSATASDSLHVHESEPFVGREEERETLQTAFDASESRGAAIVHLRGGSGLGKTRLVRRFMLSLRRDHHAVVLSGRCYERESVPFKTLDSFIDSLARHLARLSAIEAASLLPRNARSLARLFPVLQTVDAIANSPRREAEDADEQELRRHAIEALRELLSRMADRRPVVIHIDDLQWGDPDGLALLHELMIDPPPVFMVLSYRDDETTAAALDRLRDPCPEVRCFDLMLRPLDTETCERLASRLLPDAPPTVIQAIAEEARGHPLFVAELARARFEGEHTGEDDDHPSLGALVMHRIHRCSPQAQRLLQILSVAGTRLPWSLVANVAGLPTAQRTPVNELAKAHLVRTRSADGHEELEVEHDEIRRAVLRSLDEGTIREHHRSLAATYGQFGQAFAAAMHLQAAGEIHRAAEQAAVAAREARESLAFDRAAELYALALRDPDAPPWERQRLRVAMGDALAAAGRAREAATALLEALRQAPTEQAHVLRRRAAELLLQSGHIDEGLEHLRLVLDDAGLQLPRSSIAAKLSYLWDGARMRWRKPSVRLQRPERLDEASAKRLDACWSAGTGLALSDPVTAAVFHARRLELAQRAGEPRRLVQALVIYAAQIASRGASAEPLAARFANAAREVAQGVSDPHTRGLLLFLEGARAYSMGRWRDASDLCDRSATIFREECTGASWEATLAELHGESALFWMGRVLELRRRLTRNIEEARRRSDLLAEVSRSASGLGCITWLAQDQPERAEAMLTATLQRWTDRATHLQHFWGQQSQTMIDLYRGDSEGWARLLGGWPRRRQVIRRIQVMRVAAWSLRSVFACRMVAAGSPVGHEPRRAAKVLAKQRLAWTTPFAELAEAGVALAQRADQRADACLARATAGFEAHGMELQAAAARRARGELLGGDAGQALMAKADHFMREQGVADPAAMRRVFAPPVLERSDLGEGVTWSRRRC